ncbi:MAG: SDR family NAD(P)-dependent oxidoreductase [Fusobacteriaceae bacterium]|nr:SDR family NAD(P)-dependent oxidoreductase [Fusobacteriaceae bacterium]
MYALITGATGGIGNALVDIFIENGYIVIATGRDIVKLNGLKDLYGDKIVIKRVDLTKETDDFIKYLELENIEIDVLINNAGLGQLNYYEDIDFSDENEMIEVNVLALSKFTHYFYKKFRNKGKGGIINVSSVAALLNGGPLMAGYYASKSYVKSLTLSLVSENDNKNIKIMLLCPGPTFSNFVGMNLEKTFLNKLYMTMPEYVAQRCYSDFMKNKMISIPGIINKISILLSNIIPIRVIMYLTKKFQEKKISKK